MLPSFIGGILDHNCRKSLVLAKGFIFYLFLMDEEDELIDRVAESLMFQLVDAHLTVA